MKDRSALKKSEVYIIADNIFSPLGATTAENFETVKKGESGLQQHINPAISNNTFCASLLSNNGWLEHIDLGYTKFEYLLIESIGKALAESGLQPTDKDTVLIISTTKGNISLLETEEYNEALVNRIALTTSAKLVAEHFGFVNTPIIISNACISGVMGVISGMRLLQGGRYKHAVIAGADVISKFIVSGFESFQALSSAICKPFDKSRNGLNLGEGAGTIILSVDEKYKGKTRVTGGAISNDANHISGPSRTGEELAYAIKTAVDEADLSAESIDFVSAHGTATPYNDEMEATAISLAGLQSAPVYSLKPHYGHTLGAAGVIESIISIYAMRQNLVLPTPGF
jgi:3-oxoacyl-[acyl-carrier-protein] synthase-1